MFHYLRALFSCVAYLQLLSVGKIQREVQRRMRSTVVLLTAPVLSTVRVPCGFAEYAGRTDEGTGIDCQRS